MKYIISMHVNVSPILWQSSGDMHFDSGWISHENQFYNWLVNNKGNVETADQSS